MAIFAPVFGKSMLQLLGKLLDAHKIEAYSREPDTAIELHVQWLLKRDVFNPNDNDPAVFLRDFAADFGNRVQTGRQLELLYRVKQLEEEVEMLKQKLVFAENTIDELSFEKS